jgi:hypothetical protein
MQSRMGRLAALAPRPGTRRKNGPSLGPNLGRALMSASPDADSCQLDEGEVIGREFVVTGGDTPRLRFESLNHVQPTPSTGISEIEKVASVACITSLQQPDFWLRFELRQKATLKVDRKRQGAKASDRELIAQFGAHHSSL